jgi:hypothetical protein
VASDRQVAEAPGRRIASTPAIAAFTGAAIVVVVVGLFGARMDGAIAIGVIVGLGIAILRRPRSGYYVLLFVALIADRHLWTFSPWTDRLGFYVFANWWKLLSPGAERAFGFLVVNTVDVLLLAIVLGTVIRLARLRTWPAIRHDAVLAFAYLLALLVMLAYGLITGGDLKPALWQTRPFLHFVVLALVGSQLLRTAADVRNVIWILALACAFKAVQITWIFFVHAGGRFGPWREILGHEDSVFLAALLVLAAVLVVYGARGSQTIFLVASAPVMLGALLVNQRRASYAALAVSLLLAPLLLHERRRAAVKLLLPVAAIGLLYAVVFWNRPDDPWALPLQKFKSVVVAEVGTTDYSSNLYRVAENVNLRRTILAHPLGLGFGHPFDLDMPLPDISFLLPLWRYHPHNMILGIWMSLGTVGFIVFLSFLGSTVLLAAHALRRHTDPYAKAVSYFLATSLMSALFVGAVDQFIWLERGVLFVAALVAMVSALSRLAEP